MEGRVREELEEERESQNNETSHMQAVLTPTTSTLSSLAGNTSPI